MTRRLINHPQISLSDNETLDILTEAHKQYQEYLRLVEIPVFPEFPEEPQTVYSWDNPIGLVFNDTEESTSAFRFRSKT